MRSNQQSKRSRSRNSNNRKSSNPLSRNYESNGPDVRIRGNASTIAEKYTQLARDAHSSGDSVAAENYLQHAEHYNRIISAAQAQYQQQQQARNEQNENRSSDSDNDDDNERDDNSFGRPQQGRSSGEQQSQSGSRREEQSDNAESASAVEAEKTSKADSSASDDADDKQDEKPKPRRPRRKKVSEEAPAEASASGDPSKSPQPSVGDLPAFVTGGNETAAAE